MKTLLLLSLLISSLSFAEHRGGNGGHPFEISLKSRLQRVGIFIMENPVLFGKVSETNWALVASAANITITEDKLFDKFGESKCALNFPAKNLIVFNKSCFLSYQQEGNVLNSILAHELLNLRGVELPKRGVSVYPYSSLFLKTDRTLAVNATKLSYLSANCALSVHDQSAWGKVSKGIVALKGFSLTSSREGSNFELVLSSEDQLQLHRLVWQKGKLLKQELAWKRKLVDLEEALIDLPQCVLL